MVDDSDHDGIGKSAAWIGDAETDSAGGVEEAATQKDGHAGGADGCGYDLTAVIQHDDGVVSKIASDDRDLHIGAAGDDNTGVDTYDLRCRVETETDRGAAGNQDGDEEQ